MAKLTRRGTAYEQKKDSKRDRGSGQGPATGLCGSAAKPGPADCVPNRWRCPNHRTRRRPCGTVGQRRPTCRFASPSTSKSPADDPAAESSAVVAAGAPKPLLGGPMLVLPAGHTSAWAAAFGPDGQRVLLGRANSTSGSANSRRLKAAWLLGPRRRPELHLDRPSARRQGRGLQLWPAGGSLGPGTGRPSQDTESARITDLRRAQRPDQRRRVQPGRPTRADRLARPDGHPLGCRQRQTAGVRGHLEAVTSVAFSAGTRQVLTGSWDKTAILWNAANGGDCGLSRAMRGHPVRRRNRSPPWHSCLRSGRS